MRAVRALSWIELKLFLPEPVTAPRPAWVGWPASWSGVAFAALVGALSFAAIGALIGVAMPTARAAQGLSACCSGSS